MNVLPARSGSPRGAPGLDAFAAEASRVADLRRLARRYGTGAAIALAALTGVAWWGAVTPSRPVTPAPGVLRVESDPGGAEVRVDGVLRGSTPVDVTLKGGAHALTVSGSQGTRTATITVRAGTHTVDHTTWIPAPPQAPPAHSAIPDVPQRPAPVPALGATGPGSLDATAPVPLQIYEGTRLVGTTGTGRLTLPAGMHALDFVSEPLGFRVQHVVPITSQALAVVAIDVPRVPLSVNATPWADVWIDGVRVGETPMGDLLEPIGVHEIEFRHPQLGTKRTTITVSLKGTARVAIDMRVP
jgi:hypothetical protein